MLKLYDNIQTLRLLQTRGGKRYKEIVDILNLEPTTENIKLLREYLVKIEKEFNG